MPTCSNCGSFVSKDYVRVLSPPDADGVRACPECPDRVRYEGKVREARSSRRG
ncbi:DUF7563 family protein [Halorubrum gandharaense]